MDAASPDPGQDLEIRGRVESIERLPLGGDQFANPFFPQTQHFRHLLLGESRFLSGALDLDEPEVFGHGVVEINGRVLVLVVIEVEAADLLPDAGTDRRRELAHGRFRHLLGGNKTAEGHLGGHHRTGDRGGAGPPVGAQHVAIDPKGPHSQTLKVDHRPQAATDETLDLGTATVEFAPADVSWLPLQGRVWQHVVFRGEPAARDSLGLHPRRHARLQHRAADHARFAEIHEDTPVRERGDVELEPDFAHRVGGAAINSIHEPRPSSKTHPFASVHIRGCVADGCHDR